MTTPQWFKAARSAWEHRQRRQRIYRYFDCRWQSAWGPEQSRISSLSPTGCYIEDRFTVPQSGEEIEELAFDLPTGRVNTRGVVLDTMPGIGFAVRFLGVDARTRNCLIALVQQHRAATAH
jgi:hypothetical protein